MDFRVELNKMEPVPGSLQDMKKQLARCEEELRQINRALDWQIKRKEQVSRRILNAADWLERQTGTAMVMSNSLEQVIALYQAAEQRIIGQAGGETAGTESLSEEAKNYLESVDWDHVDWGSLMKNLAMLMTGRWDLLLIDKAISYYQKLQEEKKAEIAKWTETIKDEKTREFLTNDPKYTDKLRKTYENANGSAKELYDKYKDDIKIASMEADSSYHLKGELYLDRDGGMKDPRGASSVFYHESGHWIVDAEGWVSGGTMTQEFQAFDQAVKEDVGNFISGIEAEQRALYEGKFSGAQLEAKVRSATIAQLKDMLGGKNTHVLNGVSDMIDAQSNGAYNITYGHADGYWDANPTRQANEAFAEMFSADFCNDTVETEFMKTHFPNAYREYENLKQLALSRGNS